MTKEVAGETNLEDRASVISYFIQTANVSSTLYSLVAIVMFVSTL